MQKSLIVIMDLSKAHKRCDEAKQAATAELDAHLQQGWHIKQSIPMSGHSMHFTTSLVILEKPDA